MTHAILIIDLAFGDCGKGTVVDFLTRHHRAHTVVRFNGGPQAAHNVVTADGRHHTFSQFGSGTLVPGIRTLLSRFMLIEPYALFNEARHWLAITHLDRVAALPPKVCVAYEGVELQPPVDRDLARQERLTRAVLGCRPIYRELSDTSADGLVRRIEEELQCPAKLLSFGPHSGGKRLLD